MLVLLTILGLGSEKEKLSSSLFAQRERDMHQQIRQGSSCCRAFDKLIWCDCLHLRILDSISSKLKPLVSGTRRTTNKSDSKAITPKRRKTFSAPSNSYETKYSVFNHPREVKYRTSKSRSLEINYL